ncbi:MAG: glycosyl hydrolase [Candidatus Sumerlaeaceae bacterium]|nr:glycosyl hydrolase [Candidatus Sumerlaeaceae bacterium]
MRLIIAFLTITLVLGLGWPSSVSARRITPDFFGINGVAFLHYRDAADATQTAERRMALMKEIGATWDRTDMWWSLVEPEPGVWNWEKTDWVMDFFARNGMRVQPILNYTAKWMEPNAPASQRDFDQFGEYAYQVMKRYGNKAKWFEAWNEPNIPTFWHPQPNVEHYFGVLKASYRASRRAGGGARIIGAVTSMTDIVWIERLARLGGLTYMDAISIHPYCLAGGVDEMDFTRQVRNVRKVLARHGRPDMPIWITEMGRQADIAKPAQVDAQARFVVQAYTVAAAEGIERLIWFCVQDWMEGKELSGYGFMSPPPDNKVKKSAKAYRATVDALTGARYRGVVPLKDGVVYVFDKGRGSLAVAWADRFRTIQWAPEGAPSATVRNVFGETQPAAPGQPFTLTDMPVFIEFAKPLRPGGLVAARPEREQLLVNPSFEDGEGRDLYDWERGAFNAGHKDGQFGVMSDGAADGKRAAVITAGKDAMYMSAPVPALPGETYRLSAAMRTEAATGENCVQLMWYGNSGWRLIEGPKSKSLTGQSGGWTTVTVEGIVPEDADVVRVALVSKGNTGRVMFDSLDLRRSEPQVGESRGSESKGGEPRPTPAMRTKSAKPKAKASGKRRPVRAKPVKTPCPTCPFFSQLQ